jgi:transcriptional regulator GlxA family with amidase domain
MSAPVTSAERADRVIGFLLTDQFALMSYASAIEPLRAANVLAGRELYRWLHVTPDGRPVTASNGVVITADRSVGEPIVIDTLLVCAGGNPARFDEPAVLAWLRGQAQRGVRVGGVSGGPYILARAGLLAGYRCTIHWEHAPALAEAFPDLDLRHSLYEIDRDRLTCAGGIAALDMMVDLIERDHGGALGAAVGEWHLRTQVRPGAASQRMTLRERFGVSSEKVLRVLAYMETHLEDPATVEQLAEVAGSTPRQLQRLFLQHLGQTPMRQYLSLRLDRGQTLLQQTTMPLTEVAMACGFVNPNHFSRAYKDRFGHPPREERAPGGRRSVKG